jgi:hypothetical protein
MFLLYLIQNIPAIVKAAVIHKNELITFADAFHHGSKPAEKLFQRSLTVEHRHNYRIFHFVHGMILHKVRRK